MKKNEQSEKRGRGRPALGGTVMTHIRLPADMVEAIDAIADPGKRAAFIRAAIAREIERRQRGEVQGD